MKKKLDSTEFLKIVLSRCINSKDKNWISYSFLSKSNKKKEEQKSLINNFIDLGFIKEEKKGRKNGIKILKKGINKYQESLSTEEKINFLKNLLKDYEKNIPIILATLKETSCYVNNMASIISCDFFKNFNKELEDKFNEILKDFKHLSFFIDISINIKKCIHSVNKEFENKFSEKIRENEKYKIVVENKINNLEKSVNKVQSEIIYIHHLLKTISENYVEIAPKTEKYSDVHIEEELQKAYIRAKEKAPYSTSIELPILFNEVIKILHFLSKEKYIEIIKKLKQQEKINLHYVEKIESAKEKDLSINTTFGVIYYVSWKDCE